MSNRVNDRVEMHAIVRGYVQGVGFRATAYVQATRLGITGTVKNLADGSVEIYAQGEKHNLERFLSEMKDHPRLPKVDQVDKKYYPPSKLFKKFQIVY